MTDSSLSGLITSEKLKAAADQIIQAQSWILAEWERRVRERLPAARKLGSLPLRDHLPEFIKVLAQSLHRAAMPPVTTQGCESGPPSDACREVSAQHGLLRAETTDYTLSQVIREYGILQSVIFASLTNAKCDFAEPLNLILSNINEGITKASVEFTEKQGEEIKASKADLAKDLIALKRVENELKQTVSMLEDETTLRDRFVATLTHDLRNPMTAIRTSAQIITRYPEKHEKHGAMAERILRSLDRADRMITNLLDSSRIRSGEKMHLLTDACDYRHVVEETLHDLVITGGDRFLFVCDRYQISGYGDADAFRRILENLATNAIKYGDSSAEIRINLSLDNQRVKLEVHNEGPAIPAEEQAHLFDPFRRAVSVQKSEKKGWGLGLTLVRGLAEVQGGSVEVVSVDGQGTTFTVLLPLDCRQIRL